MFWLRNKKIIFSYALLSGGLVNFLKFLTLFNSNTDHLYSQWLNSVIYWLKNHCTDWSQTGVMSFGRQFDFHEVIYLIQPFKIDYRLHNVVFTTNGRSKFMQKNVFQSKQEL